MNHTSTKRNPYVSHGVSRRARPIKLLAPGKIVKDAERARLENEVKELEREIEENSRNTDFDLRIVSDLIDIDEDYVTAEWWDLPFLVNGRYSADRSSVSFEFIKKEMKDYPSAARAVKPDEANIKILLTREEQRKLRRQRRLAQHREKQERIILGLEPAPEPKMKLSTFMRVLGTDAAQDPTAVEKVVREQEEKRRREHIEANEARKLSTEEKKEKKIQKLKRQVETSKMGVLFRVPKLDLTKNISRVKANAIELFLKGTVIKSPSGTFIVAQGGDPSLKKFKRLLMEKIDWEEDGGVEVLWEGSVQEIGFERFGVEKFDLMVQVEEYLKLKDCEGLVGHLIKYNNC